ncbi:hypothetical protein JCM10207_005703 [Rhodosporidiobolus poonsookiae]
MPDARPPRLASPTPQFLRQRPPRFSLTSLTVHIPSSSSSTSAKPTDAPPPPSRWNTPEFYAYYAVFLLVVPCMWRIGCRVSRATNPLYWQYAHRLSDGWLFGWKVDVTDAQYHLFRSHLPLLVSLAFLHLTLSHAFRLVFRPSALARARFSAPFSCALLVALHGSSALKIALILAANWGVSRLSRGRRSKGWWRREWTPFAVWGFNIGVLFLNELTHGWRFGAVAPWLGFLDAHPGLLPRWHISWNISMLRLVSWGMEHHWACCAADELEGGEGGLGAAEGGGGGTQMTSPLMKVSLWKRLGPSTHRQMWRRSLRTSPAYATPTSQASSSQAPPSRPPSALSPTTDFPPSLYLAYVLYPPLYLAGPIMSYPSFLSAFSPPCSPPSPTSSSSDAPQTPPYDELSPRALAAYGVRFLACLVTMELTLHAMHPAALKDVEGWWRDLSPAEVAMVGFWNLIVVWLKLLLPWRLFRLWSLLDGIAAPENMVRCMANNYSVSGFWRSWHRSYNLWVIRYLYVPLGGSSRPLLATLGVFTFVALWHDLRLRLLVWGWGVTLFVVPEMVGRRLVPASKFGTKPWYRPLAALGGVLNILLLMTANLVGFVVGVDGARELWGKMVGGWEGWSFLLIACACLFVAVQVMFEYREEERRRGIVRKC